MSAAEGRRIMLGELLLRAGVITEEQLRTALAEQKKWGGKLGYLLVEMNFLEEETLVKALSKQLGLPRIDFKGLVISREALDQIDADFADQRQVMPISYDPAKKTLVVATSDPGDLAVIDDLGFRTGCRVKVAIAGERALARAIREHYYAERAPRKSPGDADDDKPMKLVNPQGNTMVRKASDIQKGRPPTSEGNDIGTQIEKLEQLQRKQVRVLKAVVELLIEKGYVNREEYRRKVEP